MVGRRTTREVKLVLNEIILKEKVIDIAESVLIWHHVIGPRLLSPPSLWLSSSMMPSLSYLPSPSLL